MCSDPVILRDSCQAESACALQESALLLDLALRCAVLPYEERPRNEVLGKISKFGQNQWNVTSNIRLVFSLQNMDLSLFSLQIVTVFSDHAHR